MRLGESSGVLNWSANAPHEDTSWSIEARSAAKDTRDRPDPVVSRVASRASRAFSWLSNTVANEAKVVFSLRRADVA